MRLPSLAGRSGNVWAFTGVGLLIYLPVSWMLGRWLGLTGVDLWVLRIGLWLLGFVVAGLVIWGLPQRAGAEPPVDDELDTVLRAARARLAEARVAGGVGARLRRTPLLMVLGPVGSAKTSVVVHSGLEPERLGGAVHHGDAIAPTGSANLWYARETVLVEAGGRFAADAARFGSLLRRVRPERLRPVLTGRAAAPRAALVCFSCEELLKPGAAEAAPAAARELRGLLSRIAKSVGAQLPVYVLFTKADRFKFFSEYARSLARDEAHDVVGATLRWPEPAPIGLYAESEFRRVSESLRLLFRGLAAKRLQVLAREGESDGKAAAYEFPREFQKVFPVVTQFLVELCRPRELQVAPVLRGFYFAGVRAVIVSDAQEAPQAPVAQGGGRIAATQVFDLPGIQPPAAAAAPGGGGSRRRPQWLFLGRLFNDVLLRDRAALAAARGSAATKLWRRGMLATAAVLLLILNLDFIGSCFGNRALAARAADATRDLADAVSTEPELPPEETLRRLDRMRELVEGLGGYERGFFSWMSPRRLTGAALYNELRRIYFARFSSVLLGPGRQALLRSLQDLAESGEYGRTYNALKAYLMTTTHPEHLDARFLVPVMTERWLANRPIDSTRAELARRQFEFYAGKLCAAYPCGAEAVAPAVARARDLLRAYAGPERIYQAIISGASAQHAGVRFNQVFPGTEGVLVNPYEVPGAFTPAGWDFLRDALANPAKYFEAEAWVVGGGGQVDFDRAKLEKELRAFYRKEYIEQWRNFLKNASVVPYSGASDAAKKLARLSDNLSPLLQLVALVSRNTNVDSGVIGAAFQPAHAVVPPDSKKYVTESNQGYMTALAGLQAAVEQVGPASEPGAYGPAQESARGTRMALSQIAQGFRIDGDAGAVGADVRTLLEKPVTRLDRFLDYMPASAANAQAARLCREFSALKRKYPFTSNPNAQQATIAEVNAFFQPGSGALWRAYEAAWRPILVQQGPQYVAVAGGAVTPSLRFVVFFNRAAAFSAALFRGGATEPRLDFSLKPQFTQSIPAVIFNVDGQPGRFTRLSAAAQRFTWLGARAREVRLAAEIRGRDEQLLAFTGTWALFKLFQRADWRSDGEIYYVTWREPVQGGGQAVSIEAELSLGGAPPILRRDFLVGMNCVSRVSR